jgi:hypothetical protein
MKLAGVLTALPGTLPRAGSAHDTRRLDILRFDRLVYRPLGGGDLGIVRAHLNHEPADCGPLHVSVADQRAP